MRVRVRVRVRDRDRVKGIGLKLDLLFQAALLCVCALGFDYFTWQVRVRP